MITWDIHIHNVAWFSSLRQPTRPLNLDSGVTEQPKNKLYKSDGKAHV